MQISKIVLHADASDSFNSRAVVATELARRTDADLIAVHGLPGGSTIHAEFTMPRELWNNYKELYWGYENRSREMLQAQADTREIDFCWSRHDDDVVGAIIEQSRLADLVVLSRTNQQAPDRGAAVEPGKIISVCDRPCLILPMEVSSDWWPTRIAVAWNGTRQSARAVRESVSFLTQADEVRVVSVSDEASFNEADISALQDYFDRHGVNAFFDVEPDAPTFIEEETIEAYCIDREMNLLVMGAYGHRKRLEQVFGGVTDSVIKQFPIPVLMVH